MKKYIAKPDTWFDVGTVVELLIDCKDDPERTGLFRGYKNGKVDEEMCFFEEFEVVDEKENFR